MNRADLQVLAAARVADAEALIDAGRFAAAYYLLGYSVECALKACAARQFRQDEVPDKKVVNEFYTHKLDQLVGISGAKAALDARTATDRPFEENWKTVSDWTEASRYDHSISEAMARDMLVAVSDANTGVLPWLRTQW